MKQGQIIEVVKERFANDERLKALFLSGSYGNGTHDAWSDVDFLVIVDDENRQGVISDFLEAAESVGEMVSSNRMELGATLVHSALADWTRFDMVAGEEKVLTGKSRDGLKPLIDPGNLWSGLPETIKWRGPNPQQVEFLIKEFTRILALTSVGKGRDEIATAMSGSGLLRNNLIALMTQAVPMADTGGALHMTKIFSEEHQRQVLELPVVRPDWESIFAFTRACAAIFYPLARSLAKDARVTWPERYIEAMQAHLSESIGLDIQTV